MPNLTLQGTIESKILLLRGKRVMLDKDLAELYEVETRSLIQAVKRNIERFPEGFMFQLTSDEAKYSRSQIVILKHGHNIKYLPYAFTEQGVAMLSSVLRSKRAIQVNIQIMKTFTKIREMLESHRYLRIKIEALERKYNHQFKVVFDAIKQLLIEPPQKPKKKIGFCIE